MYFPRSEFAMTLVASRPGDAFIDLIANSILEVILPSIVVKNCVLIAVFDSVSNITHLPVNLFIKSSFQSFYIHCIIISC